MNKREAKKIALDLAAALIEAEIGNPSELTEDTDTKVANEMREMVRSLRARLARMEKVDRKDGQP